MWSPWASEPDRKVEGVWLGLLWRVELRGDFVLQGGEGVGEECGGEHGDEDGEGGYCVEGNNRERVWLTAGNYARLSGKEDMDEKRLRVAQNRYLMHKDYSDGVGENGAELKEGGVENCEISDEVLIWEEKEL